MSSRAKTKGTLTMHYHGRGLYALVERGLQKINLQPPFGRTYLIRVDSFGNFEKLASRPQKSTILLGQFNFIGIQA